MTKIHMETEQVERFAAQMNRQSQMMQESVDLIYHQIESAPWQGSSKDEFLMQLADCRQRLLQYSQQMQELQAAVRAEEAQWVEAAAVFGSGVGAGGGLENSFISTAYAGIVGSFVDLGNLGVDAYGTFLGDHTLEGVFKYLQQEDDIKDFRSEIEKANLRFELYDKDGNLVDAFGAENGDVVRVSWVDPDENPDAWGAYDPGPPPTIQISRELQDGSEYNLRQTVVHEMQHALDYQSGQVDIDIRQAPFQKIENTDFSSMSQQTLDNTDWQSLEESCAASCMERMKTEIHAHDRGYQFDPKANPSEDVLNMDATYTPEECKVILNDRDYAATYEANIRDSFAEKGVIAEVDVYWDDQSNKIQVDIISVEKASGNGDAK